MNRKLYTAKDVAYDRTTDEYVCGERRFVTDASGNVYEREANHNRFFCKLNGQSAKRAIAGALEDDAINCNDEGC